MIRRTSFAALAVCVACTVCGADRLSFAAAKRRPVVDTYFGVTVRDDYQWLENVQDPAVRTWAEKQDARTRRWLENTSQFAAIRHRLQAINDRSSIEYLSLVDTGSGLFALAAMPDKQQNVIVRLASLEASVQPEIIVDPAVVDPTGATAIDWWVPSRSGARIAVCLSQRGSELGSLHFFDTASGVPLADRIPRVQIPTGGGSAAWSSDESAVYYTRYPAPGERPDADLQFYQQIFLHRLGTDSAQDVYALGREFPRIAEIELKTSPDGLFTLARVANGDGGDFAFYLLNEAAGSWQSIAQCSDGVKDAVLADDGMLYLLTRGEAPRGRILRMPLEQPDLDSAAQVIAQGDGVIRDFAVHEGRVYVNDVVAGTARLHQFSGDGRSTRAVALPADCAVEGLVPRRDGSLLIRLERYVEPPAWHQFNPTRSSLHKTALAGTSPVDFSDIRIEHQQARAADGVEIPLTILVPARVAPGTPAPLLLTAYGAYGAINQPEFIAHRRVWFDAGGVLAIAHVRGGGEFGETWHKAGNLASKQTTFSDFAACAQHLIASRWTRADQLAIQGGSAGGLLMGASLTQHPKLFRAVVARVGLFDMLRAERAPNGEFNTTEFGTVKVREQFEALHAYSPYHHVAPGVDYPAVLLTTGLHDGRVPPGHSFKMAARLQASTGSRHPVLLRVDAGSGHGRGTTRKARVDERADVYAFLFAQLGMTLPGK